MSTERTDTERLEWMVNRDAELFQMPDNTWIVCGCNISSCAGNTFREAIDSAMDVVSE